MNSLYIYEIEDSICHVCEKPEDVSDASAVAIIFFAEELERTVFKSWFDYVSKFVRYHAGEWAQTYERVYLGPYSPIPDSMLCQATANGLTLCAFADIVLPKGMTAAPSSIVRDPNDFNIEMKMEVMKAHIVLGEKAKAVTR